MALLLLGVYPVFYMGGDFWWQHVALLILLLSYSSWSLIYWWYGKKVDELSLKPFTIVFFLPLIWGGFQLIPSRAICSFLSPKATDIWSRFAELGLGASRFCLSLAQDETYLRLGIIFTALLLFVLLCSLFKKQMQVRLILWALCLGAFFNALLSFTQTFSKGSKGMSNIAVFTGTFLNRNHFGFLMIIGVLSALALLVINTSSKLRHSRAEKNDGRRYRPLCNILLLIFVFTEFTALVMSQSRGAFVGISISLLMFMVGWFWKEHHNMRDKGRQLMLALIIIVSAAALFALPFALDALSKRYQVLVDNDLTMNDRVRIWRVTLEYIKDYWVTGSGLGSYRYLIQRYEEGKVISNYIEHAHNDYLEMLAECGLVIGGILICYILWYLWQGFKHIWYQQDNTYKWCGWAALSALTGCAFHELFDYSAQAWTNTMAVSALFAVVALCRTHDYVPEEETWSNRGRHHHSHDDENDGELVKRWPLLLVCACLLCFVVPEIKHIRISFLHSKLVHMMAAKNSFWKPGVADMERRIAMAHRVEKVLPEQEIDLELAKLYANYARISKENSKEHWQRACDYISKAMRNAPVYGYQAEECAYIFRQANRKYARRDSDYMLLCLNKWAYECQPTIYKCALETVYQFYMYYWRALQVYPEDVEETFDYTLELLKRCNALSPERCGELLPIMVGLAKNDEQLMAFVPDIFKVRMKLLDYFISVRHYESALKLNKLMLAGGNLQGNELKSVLNARINIAELTGQVQDAELYRQNLAELCKQVKLDILHDIETEMNQGMKPDFANRLEGIALTVPTLPGECLLKCRQYQYFGKGVDAIHAMMPLVYSEELPSLEILRDARKMIDFDTSYLTGDGMKLRIAFLKAAIDVMTAEQSGHKDVAKALVELTKIEEEYLHSVWIQFHLIPYFRGRAYELQGQRDKAVSAYRTSLGICPRNLYVIRRLNALSPDALNSDEREILRIATNRKDVLARVSSNVALLCFDSDVKEIADLHNKITWSTYMLCTGDIKADYRFKLVFSDARGFAFAHDMFWVSEQQPMVSWRVGEVIRRDFVCQPHMETLKQRRRVMESGEVLVHLEARLHNQQQQLVPNVILPAWHNK